ECFSLQSINKTLPALIPQLPSEIEQKSFSEWLSLSKPSLLSHAYDWVNELSLRYSTLIQSSKLINGIKIAFKFLREPKITPINQVAVLLAQPKTKKIAYLLENNIALKKGDQLNLNETPVIDCFSSLYESSEDFQHFKDPLSKKIFCQIKFLAAEISFDLSSIILSEPYLDATHQPSERFQPYKNLSEVFEDNYGNLLPKTLIVGGVLSRSYEQDCNSINVINSQQINFEENNHYSLQEKVDDLLTEWNEKYNIDTSSFFSNDNEAINQKQIGCWYNSLKDNLANWRIISFENWRPIYKMDLDDSNYHIVFNGENSLTQDNQSKLIIEFPRPLTDNNYHIFGNVVKRNNYKSWERVQEVIVTFDHIDQHRCVSFIHKSDNISIPADIYLKTEGIYTDSVLVTSFTNKSQNDFSLYNINVKRWYGNTVVLKVKELIKNNSVQNLHENIIIHWCMIDTNGKKLVNNNNEVCPWSLYGLTFNEKSAKVEIAPVYYGPSDSSITLEKAIEQHSKQNNDTQKTFIRFKDEKNPKAIKFTGYIKAVENNTQEITRYYEGSADCEDSNRQ
ncbi:9607_t:CDS:2, partial [Racocetra fulgida]